LCGLVGVIGAYEEALFYEVVSILIDWKGKSMTTITTYQSLTSWKDMEMIFLTRFFPTSKHMEAKTTIDTFVQGADEPPCEA